MPRFKVDVQIMPRAQLLDPQGNAIEHALKSLGFDAVKDVRIGKALTFDVDQPDAENAQRSARAMCEKLLSNPVTEDFSVSVTEVL